MLGLGCFRQQVAACSSMFSSFIRVRLMGTERRQRWADKIRISSKRKAAAGGLVKKTTHKYESPERFALRIYETRRAAHRTQFEIPAYPPNMFRMSVPLPTEDPKLENRFQFSLPAKRVAQLSQPAQKALSLAFGNSRQILKAKIHEQIESFKRSPNDTGSGEVQVASLTLRIANLTRHMQGHKQDVAQKRRIQIMVQQRRRMLKYLKRTDLQRYSSTITTLGLNDIG